MRAATGHFTVKSLLVLLPAALFALQLIQIFDFSSSSWGSLTRSRAPRDKPPSGADSLCQSASETKDQFSSVDKRIIDVLGGSWTGRSWSEPWVVGTNAATPTAMPSNTPLLAFVHNSIIDTAVLGEQAHIVRLLELAYGWRKFVPRQTGPDAGVLWGSELLAQDLVQALGRLPDVLLFMEQESLLATAAANPHLSGVQLWLYVDDPHWHASNYVESATARDRRQAALTQAHKLLALKAPQLPKYYPQLDSSRILWLSHGAGPEYILPLNPEPIPIILLAGATYPAWYPLRSHVQGLVKKADTRFMQYRHPGYYDNGYYTRSGPFRSIPNSDLAQAFQSALACITDGGELRYVLAKVYEITATGCLLLLDQGIAEQVAWQGFYPGVHYVSYTKSTIDAVADAVLDPRNRKMVDTIRAQGQARTMARHLYTHKALMIHEAAVQSAVPAYPFPNVSYYDQIDIVQKLASMQ